MPTLTTPKNIEDIKRYHKAYSKFRGVDFSTDPTQVSDSRSPLCQNLISDLAGFPEKRLGWRTLFTIDAPINGMFFAVFESGAEKFIVHGGTKLYTWTDAGATLIYSNMNNARSTAFSHDGKLYILDGQSYLVATETGDTVGVASVSANAFTPTTVIGAPAAGGGTPFEAVNMLTGISIHAPRAGSDQVIRVYVQNATYFNPRSPCGERRCMRPACSVSSVFQSTLPVRGATMNNARSTAFSHDFNPRSPCGERPTPHTHGSRVKAFQSTLPVRGATAIYCAFASSKRNIYSISYSKHCERYKRQTSFN